MTRMKEAPAVYILNNFKCRPSWLLPILFVIGLIAVAAMLMAAPALAADVADQPDTPVLTGLPIGVVIVSFVMTGIGYGLNYVLPFLKTDAQKGLAHVLYQMVGVAAFEVATSSDFGFNQQTLVAFVTALATFGFSHGLLFKPTGWSTKLGGGRNKSEGPMLTSMARPVQLGLTVDEMLEPSPLETKVMNILASSGLPAPAVQVVDPVRWV
jgi:hypothetical protein